MATDTDTRHESVSQGGWTPALSEMGTVYCSPRCGFKCRRVAYDRAVDEADALAARMGDGWSPHVWENWGWNYSVKKGCATISPMKDGSSHKGDWTVTGYTAWIEPPSADGLGSAIQFIVNGLDPQDALGFATQEANGLIALIRSNLDEIAA